MPALPHGLGGLALFTRLYLFCVVALPNSYGCECPQGLAGKLQLIGLVLVRR